VTATGEFSYADVAVSLQRTYRIAPGTVFERDALKHLQGIESGNARRFSARQSGPHPGTNRHIARFL
jgi:hypothetical protein